MWSNDIKYIISQVCVVIAMLFLASTFFIKSKKWVLILNIPVSVFFAIQFCLLGAYTGVIINTIGLIRCFWFYFNDKFGKKQDLISFITINALLLIFGIITYTTWVDIIAIFAGFVFTFSVWQPDTLIYKWLSLLVSACWILYNIVYGSMFGLISENILLLVEITALIKYYFIDKKQVKNNNKIEQNK